MRLSGGSRARQSVAAPKGRKTRPTAAKVREAMFAVLGRRVHGARVLDLFAGSGALGLEAMSRGAASVVFVDNDGAAAFAIRRNALRLIEDEDRWRILPMHATRALRTLRGTFDVVLIDPPYDRGAGDELTLLMQRALLAADGIAVVEHRSKEALALPNTMKVLKTSKYGDTSLTFAGVRSERELQADQRSVDDRRPRTPRS
jgi:16S rRNA (guanine966-N2)-methyltransferase